MDTRVRVEAIVMLGLDRNIHRDDVELSGGKCQAQVDDVPSCTPINKLFIIHSELTVYNFCAVDPTANKFQMMR